MNNPLEEIGTLTVVMERFEKQRLPRILDIKLAVDEGQSLDEYQIAFLKEVLKDTEQYKGFVDQHPDFQDLYTRVVSLYKHIAAQALENEKRKPT